MAPRVNSELLLVGSLPADSADQALRAAAGFFGNLAFALPDGETVPGRPGSATSGPRYLLRSEDRSFFRPLADLEPGDARVFLGIVLPIDGVPGLRRRHATASRYLSDFGVAMYCGFGRQPGTDGTQTMREYARVVRAVRKTS